MMLLHAPLSAASSVSKGNIFDAMINKTKIVDKRYKF